VVLTAINSFDARTLSYKNDNWSALNGAMNLLPLETRTVVYYALGHHLLTDLTEADALSVVYLATDRSGARAISHKNEHSSALIGLVECSGKGRDVSGVLRH
jgi:hypothetical protein